MITSVFFYKHHNPKGREKSAENTIHLLQLQAKTDSLTFLCPSPYLVQRVLCHCRAWEAAPTAPRDAKKHLGRG